MLKTSEWPTLCYHTIDMLMWSTVNPTPPGPTTSRGMVFIYLTTVNLGIRYLLPRCSVGDLGMGKYWSRGMVFIYLTTVNLGIRYLLPRCSVGDLGMGKYCCPLALSETKFLSMPPYIFQSTPGVNSSPPGQNGRHFGRRQFSMHSLEWKVLYFDSNFTKCCS